MKLGLIARADNSGLGTQSWEFFRHMAPDRTLVINVGNLADHGKHCNKLTFLDRYPDAQVFNGWSPSADILARFIAGLDAVFMAETPYNYALFDMGIRTVMQYNWEFLDPRRPPPSVFAAPSTWHYEDLLRPNKTMLAVPIATDRFTPREHPPTARNFLHIVGRPAVHDRNGTQILLRALAHITAEVTVTMRSQDHGYVPGLIGALGIHTPDNVTLISDTSRVDDYWDNYTGADVLVMPRRFGGLCLPVNEALGAGMPVIMPACEPNTWLPPRWLIPAVHQGQFTARSLIDLYGVDERALAAKIDEFATDTAFYAEAQEQAAKLADSLSWATLKPEYDRVLTSG